MNTTVTPLKRDEIWVSLLVYEGSNQELSVEYFGRMDRQTFESITANNFVQGFFKLTSIGWVDEREGWVRLSDSHVRNTRFGYTQVAYFRVENIFRIVMLDESYVTRMLS